MPWKFICIEVTLSHLIIILTVSRPSSVKFQILNSKEKVFFLQGNLSFREKKINGNELLYVNKTFTFCKKIKFEFSKMMIPLGETAVQLEFLSDNL